MNSMWSQLWHGYSHVPKGMKDAVLVMDKEILCIGRHVVFKLEHSCIDVLFIYSVCNILCFLMCALIRKVICTINVCISPYNSEIMGRAGMRKCVS